MNILLYITVFVLGIILYIVLNNNCKKNNYIKEGHCGTCLEDLKECSKHCQKPNECKIVNDKYKCILPKDDELFICKYIHIPFLCK